MLIYIFKSFEKLESINKMFAESGYNRDMIVSTHVVSNYDR